MKALKSIFTLVVLVIVSMVTVIAFAADPAAVAAPAPVSLVGWFSSNEVPILKLALALSEFLALFKVFQGNGILDTIIKGLRALYVSKSSTSGQ